jgi:hypothetical protein
MTRSLLRARAVLVAATLSIPAVGQGRGEQTVWGETGLLLNPTAEVLAPAEVAVEAGYSRLHGGGGEWDWWSLAAARGLGGSTELSLSGQALRLGDTTGRVAVGVKRVLLPETVQNPAIAVGAYYRSAFKVSGGYVTFSKRSHSATEATPGPLGVHFGARYESYDWTPKASGWIGFLGMERRLSAKVSLFGEVSTRFSSQVHKDFPRALGARWALSRRGQVSVAAVRLGHALSDDTSLMVTYRLACGTGE